MTPAVRKEISNKAFNGTLALFNDFHLADGGFLNDHPERLGEFSNAIGYASSVAL